MHITCCCRFTTAGPAAAIQQQHNAMRPRIRVLNTNDLELVYSNGPVYGERLRVCFARHAHSKREKKSVPKKKALCCGPSWDQQRMVHPLAFSMGARSTVCTGA